MDQNIIMRIFKLLLFSACCGLVMGIVKECTEHSDIVIILDSSSSIRESNSGGQDNWVRMKQFLISIIEGLPLGRDKVQLGIVQFSTDAHRVADFSFTQTQHHMKDYVNRMTYLGGNTNTGAALKMAREMYVHPFDRVTARDLVFLITDGMSNINPQNTITIARDLKQRGIKVFTLGVTEYINRNELQEISSDPVSYHHFRSPDFAHLNLLVDRTLEKLCTPKVPPVVVCDTRVDLAFVLDSSGSIREKNPDDKSYDNWKILQNFVNYVIDGLTIGTDRTRVGLVLYSSQARVKFNLNSYTDAKSMKQTVNNLEYLATATNTSGALRLMLSQIFNSQNGDRPGIRNIGIVITDGESTVDANKTVLEARKAKDHGVRLFAVGLTKWIWRDELLAIASPPVKDHYFNTSSIRNAKTLVERLLVHLCNTYCDGSDENCDPDTLKNKKCLPYQNLIWRKYANHLVVGHNHMRVPGIPTADECQRLCLNDASCRSVDYSRGLKECAMSHQTKDTAADSFAPDNAVDYYEWFCDDKRPSTPSPTSDPYKNPNWKSKFNHAHRLYASHAALCLYTLVVYTHRVYF